MNQQIAKALEAADAADIAVEALVVALEKYQNAIRALRQAHATEAVACNRAKSKNVITDAVRNAGLDRFVALQTTPGTRGGLARCVIDAWGMPTP